MPINDDLVARGMRRAIEIEGAKNRLVARLIRALELVDRRTSARIAATFPASLPSTTGETVVDQFRRRVRRILESRKAQMADLVRSMTEALYELIGVEAAWAEDEVDLILAEIDAAPRVSVTKRETKGAFLAIPLLLAGAALPYRQLARDLVRDDQRRLQAALLGGLLEESRTGSVLSRLRGRRGALQRTRNALAELVITAGTHASSTARATVFRAQKVELRYVYQIIFDERTSDICIGHYERGPVYRFADVSAPLPPQHRWCRSYMIALAPGEIPDLEWGSASEWLESLDDEGQDRVLGRGKGILFRRGKLNLKTYQGKTLSALRRVAI